MPLYDDADGEQGRTLKCLLSLLSLWRSLNRKSAAIAGWRGLSGPGTRHYPSAIGHLVEGEARDEDAEGLGISSSAKGKWKTGTEIRKHDPRVMSVPNRVNAWNLTILRQSSL